jgi:hypothetical protein
MINVGKTVESYRMALESEINRWNGFARALRKDDREAFDELMDMCRNNAMAAGNACNPKKTVRHQSAIRHNRLC